LPLGEMGELCVAGDAEARRVLVVRLPSCWRLVPAALGAPGDTTNEELARALRVASSVLGDGSTLEVFADDNCIVAIISGRSGALLVMSCLVAPNTGEPIIWLPGGVAPAGIDDSYLALDAGEPEVPRPQHLLDTLSASERPIT
jgi:hypothetical protein